MCVYAIPPPRTQNGAAARRQEDAQVLWLPSPRHGPGITPPSITRGDGVHIWDSNGKRYIDGLSGLFVPLDVLPPLLRGVARVLPPTYAVSLLRGIWHGDGWSNHVNDVAVLTLMFLVCTAVSTKVFRWE